MAKLKLDAELKDGNGKVIGRRIQCLILTESNDFKRDDDGELLIAEIDDKEKIRTLKDVICESLRHEDPKAPLTGAQKSERYKL